jgi:hypothetical protein
VTNINGFDPWFPYLIALAALFLLHCHSERQNSTKEQDLPVPGFNPVGAASQVANMSIVAKTWTRSVRGLHMTLPRGARCVLPSKVQLS